MSLSLGLTTNGTAEVDNLLVGGADDNIIMPSTLISGQNLTRGAVVARITASGKWTAYASGASNGSEIPRGILAQTTDASAADAATIVYRAGVFRAAAVTGLGGNAGAITTTTNGLEAVGIYLK